MQYERRVFTGSLSFDQEAQIIVRVKDADVQYFGPPDPAIDHAWDELLRGPFDKNQLRLLTANVLTRSRTICSNATGRSSAVPTRAEAFPTYWTVLL